MIIQAILILLYNQNYAYSYALLNNRREFKSVYLHARLESSKGSGIYEYTGPTSQGGPPPEIAKLFDLSKGRKVKKEKSSFKGKSSKSSSKTKLNPNTQFVEEEGDDHVDSLERSLISKYGSKVVKESVLDKSDDDEDDYSRSSKPVRFEGFGTYATANNKLKRRNTNADSDNDKVESSKGFGSSTVQSRLRPIQEDENKTNNKKSITKSSTQMNKKKIEPFFKDDVIPTFDDDDDDDDNFDDMDDLFDDEDEDEEIDELEEFYEDIPKASKNNKKGDKNTLKTTSNILTKTSKKTIEEEIMLPSESQPVFRLRSPPPLSPQQIKDKELKEKIEKDKEEARKIAAKAKKEAEKNDFFPFEFQDGNAYVISEESAKLFSPKSFQEIGLMDTKLLSNLEFMHINQPTRIQDMSVPLMLSGNTDIIMQAQTGSGKTLAFLLPLINVIDTNKPKIQAVILASSRELVTQIGNVAERLFTNTDIRVQTLIGGANVQNQIIKLKTHRPQVVVATPGRLAELVFKLNRIKLGMVRAVIIDEVDQMLCEPYMDELVTLLEAIPMFRKTATSTATATSTSTSTKSISNSKPMIENVDDFLSDDDSDSTTTIDENEDEGEGEVTVAVEASNTQEIEKKTFTSYVCLASATSTSNTAVQAFAKKYLRPNYQPIIMDTTHQLPTGITHGLISIPRIRQLEMLRKFLNANPMVISAIIFVNDPHRVQIICDQLLEMNMVAAPLHGDTSKDDRKEILTRMRDGRLRLIVSTELAARGLDLPNLTHVINLDLPTDSQHYVHRAGRCGRAGRQGLVMNFANADTKFVVRRFGKQLHIKILDCEIRGGQVWLKKR